METWSMCVAVACRHTYPAGAVRGGAPVRMGTGASIGWPPPMHSSYLSSHPMRARPAARVGPKDQPGGRPPYAPAQRARSRHD